MSGDFDAGEFLAAYTAAIREGALMVGRCPQCTAWVWYPRPICPHCMGEGVRLEQVTGTGTLYSWTINRREPAEERAVVGYVELTEGPRVLARIVRTPWESLEPGLPVHIVVPTPEDPMPVPTFSSE